MKKIGSLVAIFLLSFYNTCFADVVIGNGPDPKGHGLQRFQVEPEPEPINYILIGLLLVVIVVCAVIIIRRKIKENRKINEEVKRKMEEKNDNK